MAHTAGHASAPGRAWQSVVATVESRLASGQLRPGDRLPGERDLAAQLGVGRSSVREGLRVLEGFGLVRTATGSGPSAGATVVGSPAGGMAELLRLHVAADAFAVRDVVATRLLLEEWVARAVAADPDRDLHAAADALALMDGTELSPDEFLALDAQFHLQLAHASGNSVVIATMAGLRAAIESYVTAGARAILPDWDEVRDQLQREHHALLDAIVAGDAKLAHDTVHSHISGYYARTGLGPL